MVHNKVLLAAPVEGFIIKGIETKLSSIGVESEYIAPKVKEIESRWKNADLIIIYTDDSISTVVDVLVYIKEICSKSDLQIMVIGAKNEYEIVSKYIPDGFIFRFYERPLDMDSFLSDVETYMNEDSRQELKKSILIVDDDVSYMTMIMEWLRDRYRISLANSGMQAISWLTKNHADLILLDYEMPVTTGPQVLEMIRSEETMADIPVMFLTGKKDKESIMKVLALKPVGYQLKTVTKDELRTNIANFFASRK